MTGEATVHELPPLYARWVGALLDAPIPRESNATCHACAMCVRDNGELPFSSYYFDASVKCCVYMPELPNFLVGRILGDVDPQAAAGKRTVTQRMSGRVGVTPLGLGRPPAYDLLLRNTAGTMGKSRALRCPHFVDEGGGACGIWKHREATCTTWFCRHVRGKTGWEFWATLRALLTHLEASLTRHCALTLGIRPEVILELQQPATPDGAQLDGDVSEASWARWWGDHADPTTFYLRCREIAEQATFDEIRAWGGSEAEVRIRAVQNAFSRLTDDALPPKLTVGNFQVVATRDGGVRATTYSLFDAIDLPTAFLPLLPLFDGRTTDEIAGDLERRGVVIEPGYLRQLVDWGVLAPA